MKIWTKISHSTKDIKSFLVHCFLLTHSLTAARNQLWVVAPSTSARAHASAAVSPVFCTIWLIHVVRGLPAGRFQSWCDMSPNLESTASFKALCAGVLADKRRIWPKKEWRRAAMVLSMLGRFVLSATALLVTKSFHLTPRIRLWHVIWNACSLCESSFNLLVIDITNKLWLSMTQATTTTATTTTTQQLPSSITAAATTTTITKWYWYQPASHWRCFQGNWVHRYVDLSSPWRVLQNASSTSPAGSVPMPS